MLLEARSRSGNESDRGSSEGPAGCVNEDFSSVFFSLGATECRGPTSATQVGGRRGRGHPGRAPGVPQRCPRPLDERRCPRPAAPVQQPLRCPGTPGGLPGPPERCPAYRAAPGWLSGAFPAGGWGGAPGIPVPPEGSSGTRRRLPASLRCNSPQYSGAAGGLLPVAGRAPGSTPCPAPTRGPRALPWQPVAPKVLEAVNNALRVTAMAIFSGGGRCQESSLGGERPNLTQCCKVPKPNKRVFPEQKKKPENRRGFLQTLPIY